MNLEEFAQHVHLKHMPKTCAVCKEISSNILRHEVQLVDPNETSRSREGAFVPLEDQDD